MLKLVPTNRKPSYEDFYSCHYSRVLNYVKKKITNPEDAEDLTSEVFLYCYNNYDSYDPEKSAITTWLYLIINSRLKNYYRDHISFADFEAVSEVMQDQSIDLDQGVYMEQLHKALMKAIRSLPERQRQIVILRYFQNKQSDEIARILNLSPGNVRVLLTRALHKLSETNESLLKEFR